MICEIALTASMAGSLGLTSRTHLSLQIDQDSNFSPLDKAEGAALFRAGRVGDIQESTLGHAAAVNGPTDEYDVLLMDSGVNFCSCRRFERKRSCPHVWAVLCKMDNKGGPAGGTNWDLALHRLERREAAKAKSSGAGQSISYALSWEDTGEGFVGLQVLGQKRLKNGRWGALKILADTHIEGLDAEDEAILAWLRGARRRGHLDYEHWGRTSGHHDPALDLILPESSLAALLPELLSTGRLHVGNQKLLDEAPLTIDPGEPWEASVGFEGDRLLRLSIDFQRGDECIPSESIHYGLEGWILTESVFRRVTPPHSVGWVAWRHETRLEIEAEDLGAFFASAQKTSLGRALSLPEGWREVSVSTEVLTPVFLLRQKERRTVVASLAFDYGNRRVQLADSESWADPSMKTVVRRDAAAEEDHRVRFLRAIGPEAEAQSARSRTLAANPAFEISPSRVPALVAELRAEGWRAEADGAVVRSTTGSSATVRSGIDWFDLEGGLDFEGETVSFPEVLDAIRNGRQQVTLGDGSQGILPEEWLQREGLLSAARVEGEALRFRRSQGLLLDMLLASAPTLDVDAQFKKTRKALSEFRVPEPVAEPRGFQGELRPYQREALGWMKFLEKLGFGGCLADDMGLGKTVQVLAYLQARKLARGGKAPTLVVAPRSVVSNWIAEAARFTPNLSVLDFSATDRHAARDQLVDHDLVLTTYALMRREIEFLSTVEFACVVLDEAQAIKNGKSQTAKASRLLQARQRLALSGTPIENHIDELWSLFEFLNPGMFASTTNLKAIAEGTSEGPQPLARALRPFILRRKKEEVAQSLPERSEQTIICEMKGPQKKVYESLLNHYRSSINKKIEKEGLGRAKMHVLEALTRLRQAACHPALFDATSPAGSAKAEALLDHLQRVVGEGHKALVFSQFTKFLGLVRKDLDTAGISYEYLDGSSRKRDQLVRRFQEDETCPVFLISLKAGGTGLNLTAADYVFLLDPWWNPAVEAQAIDRAHRIGQTRNVFAYRLIAKDTIEEKILALQEQKRALAESILSGGATTLRDLTREDLEMLLS